ncbi:hypothetical protein K435DRAFT_828227 [Dendrothele bispora CBS 962.96]|uniref:Fork-head domain-containing protein n=1 Tax=Dendrothele bispora (strain CBS 962.96) TaxID=1314807 RepID=A0A4S8MA24_DENBC|nr:hypothetical protein K435DRAFT_828227 [Dendrothele bispora CBS 962.96]
MATPDPHNTSPISQLLNTLGLTREDLQQRSDEMRQFLTTDNAKSSRVSSRGRANSSSSNISLRSLSRSNSAVASSARSLSRKSSISLRDASLSPAPVKSEPVESALPPRQYDSMELVIERQRQARKEKKQKRDRDRDLASRASVSHRSPTPSSASTQSLFDSRLQRRDDDSVDAKENPFITSGTSMESRASPSLTPQQAKYYREHTASQSHTVVPKSESPTPITFPQQQVHGTSFQYINQAQLLAQLQNATQNASSNPVTPQTNRVLPPSRGLTKSPLPPSSPPAITPQSSPVRPVVNIVSSPGPMGPAPNEESYSNLPYKLPSGPYSPNKPDLSYAALLGQAILSSSDHRLTLQEIYDWITIVYPYFKRGETTWMNSIRHVLSTTACFRKVMRDRTLGRTQWAIWDEDLECFKNGGFRKQFCKDMNGGKTASEVQRGKRSRKQNDEDGGSDRKTKKAKKDKQLSTPSVPSHPVFPPRPGPQIQSYVDSASSGEVMFPPLPPDSGLRHLTVDIENSVVFKSRVLSASQTDGDDSTADPSSPASDGALQPLPSSASTSSVPELTPNCSSSSPPPSTSDLDLDAPISISTTDKGKEKEVFQSFVNLSDLEASDEGERDVEDDMFAATRLTPVQFWGVSPRRRDMSKPGVKLKFNDLREFADSDNEQDHLLLNAVRSKQKKAKLDNPFERLPASPTHNRIKSKASASKLKTSKATRMSTPPPITEAGPSTPPQNRRLQLSPVHTPLSHKGLHMSPSASLAHYKSHLDPPPAASHDTEAPTGEFLRTPSRGRTLGFTATPVTPKRSSAFPLLEESPFKFGISPFRTPGSRSIFDPHDPRMLLDEELNRLGENQESPATGLFGRRQLLYDSPNAVLGGSPGKYKRWW